MQGKAVVQEEERTSEVKRLQPDKKRRWMVDKTWLALVVAITVALAVTLAIPKANP